MAMSGVERIVNDWAAAWSSREADKLLSLFTDDCVTRM
jgi:ketosteroid isomerase-like protein